MDYLKKICIAINEIFIYILCEIIVYIESFKYLDKISTAMRGFWAIWMISEFVMSLNYLFQY